VLRSWCVLICVLAPLTCASTALADVMALPVPLRTIYPKDELRASDFGTKDYEVNEVVRRNYLTSTSQLGQLVAVHALPAGRPVQLKSVKRMADVRKGEQVVAHYVGGGIAIQGILIPEQDGIVGDVLRAKNPETGVSVLVRVTPDGLLAVEAGP
jgi:flagellar basal body P-ring formation protein FlgA